MGRNRIKFLSTTEAWLQILRISNAPTIISNVMVGLALAIQAHRIEYSDVINPPPFHFLKPIFVISIVLLCLYFAGMVLNDAVDAKRDRTVRPQRAIPQGVITVQAALFTGFTLIAIAIVLSWRLQFETLLATCVLSGVIVVYTWLHRFLIPAIVLMGVCRTLVYIVSFTVFFSVLPNELLSYCIAIGAYTCILTYIGKYEHIKTVTHTVAIFLMYFTAIVPAVIYGPAFSLHWYLLGLFIAWTTLALWYFNFRHQPKQGMHTLLSGFCLLDCVFLATMQEYSIMIVSFICFMFTVAMHRKILGT